MRKYVGVDWTARTPYAKDIDIQATVRQNNTKPAQVRMCSCVTDQHY